MDRRRSRRSHCSKIGGNGCLLGKVIKMGKFRRNYESKRMRLLMAEDEPILSSKI
jgi:hypothetical protein